MNRRDVILLPLRILAGMVLAKLGVGADSVARAETPSGMVFTIPWHIASDTERIFLPEVRNA